MNPKISIIIPVYNVEKYIEKMLTSVKNQSFRDFEVIIVNDGSTDGSQAIIDMFCEADARFKTIVKENGGVASARNLGLEAARGEFVAFYDPDDFIPRRALEKLYKSVTKNNADMAIGIMKEVRAGESRCNARTIKLSKKQNISKYDVELPWSFSVCNKLFRLETIRENSLKFQPFKHAEDALFLFQCIFASKKITGCKTVVYEYQFRPLWESKSATQIMKLEYLNDVIKALDSIESLILNQISMESGTEKEKAQKLLDEFYVRYLHTSLLSGYYRQLWSAEEGCLEVLEAKINEIKDKIDKYLWERVVSLNRDLQLDKWIFNKETAVEEALLTFVLPEGMSDEELSIALNSIYDQGMPSFCMLVPETYKHYAAFTNRYNNIVFSKTCSISEAKTNFVMFMNKNILFSKNVIKLMIDALLKNQSIDYVSVPLKRFNDTIYTNTDQQCAFTTIQCLKNKKTRYDALDDMYGNKVFRTDVVNKDIENLKKKKIYNANMIILADSVNALVKMKQQRGSVRIKVKLIQKLLEDKLIDYIKNHYTKDDIKKLIRKEI